MSGVECTEHECMWWTAFAVARAGDPENVPAMERWDCSINWVAHFQYSANFRLNGVQAATESARNHVASLQENILQVAIARQERIPHEGNGRLVDARRED